MFTKVTPTSALTTGLNAIIIFLFGLISMATVAAIALHVHTGYTNYQKIQHIDVVREGRVHMVDSLDECTIFVSKYNTVSVSNTGNECVQTAHAVRTWENSALRVKTNPFTDAILAVVLGFLLVALSYPIMKVPATIIAYIIPSLRGAIPILNLICLLPVIAFVVVLYSSTLNQTPIAWRAPSGAVVKTYPVYMDKDAFYKRPENLYDWTDNDAVQKLNYHNFK